MGDNHMYCSRMVFALLAYALLSRPMWAESEATLPRGHVFFQTDFESDDALQQWSGSATLVPENSGGRALFVERSGDRISRNAQRANLHWGVQCNPLALTTVLIGICAM